MTYDILTLWSDLFSTNVLDCQTYIDILLIFGLDCHIYTISYIVDIWSLEKLEKNKSGHL